MLVGWFLMDGAPGSAAPWLVSLPLGLAIPPSWWREKTLAVVFDGPAAPAIAYGAFLGMRLASRLKAERTTADGRRTELH